MDSSDRISAIKFANTVAENLKKATGKALVESAKSMKQEIGKATDFRGRSLDELVKIRVTTSSVYVIFRQGYSRVTLTQAGRALGFPPVKSDWRNVYAKFKRKFQIFKVPTGFVVTVFFKGKLVPVYRIRTVKKINLKRISDRIFSEIPTKIDNYE